MHKGYKCVERERGVALIFTLAMLGLLMMMLLAFVGSMSVKKTVSSNAANKTQLNLLVDSAAARAALQMRDLEKDGDPLDYAISKPISEESGGSGSGENSIDKKFETTLKADDGDSTKKVDLYKENMVNNQHNGKTPEWINVKDSVVGNTGSPVARYAYAVIPNAYPILNLRALGNEPRIGGALNEFKLNAVDNLFPDDFTIDTSTDKPYLTDKESYKILYLGDDLKDYSSNLLTAYTTIGDNLVEDVYFYDDYTGSDPADFMLRRYDLGVDLTRKYEDTSGEKKEEKTEKFSEMDSNRRVPVLLFGNEAVAGGEKGAMNDFTTDDKMLYREGGSKIGSYATNKPAEYLPFFKKFDNGSEKGTFEEAVDLRNQIAANLIDYTLEDNATVTSDKTPKAEEIKEEEHGGITIGIPPTTQDSWNLKLSSTWPKYTGNKRTLYLNEAGVVVWFEFNAGDEGNLLNLTCHFIPMVELIDIYGLGATDKELTVDKIKDDYWMGVYGEITFDVEFEKSYQTYQDESVKFPNIYTQPSVHVGTKGMYFIPKWSDDVLILGGNNKESYCNETKSYSYIYQPNTPEPDNDEIIIKNLKVKIDAAKLLKKGKDGEFYPVDFAKIDKTIDLNDEISWRFNLRSGATTNKTLYASAYTEDPRQNLNSGDWESKGAKIYDKTPDDLEREDGTDIETFQDDDNLMSFGKVNPYKYDDVGAEEKDYEGNIKDTVGDGTGKWEIAAEFDATPEDRPISTAFIRHEPLESLWELGFIHRGIKWQTINLKTVQNMANLKNFDSEYKNGDAEILDMVCLNYGERHKIDLNARGAQFPSDNSLAQKIWEELFSLSSSDKINIGNPRPDQANELIDGDPISADKSLSSLLSLGGGEGAEPGGGAGSSNIPSELVLGSRNLFLRRSAIAPALYDAVKDKNTDAMQEAYVGKVIGLTDAYIYPPEVRVVVMAQLLNQQTGSPSDSVKKLVIMKRTLDGRYVPSEILPL